MEKFYAPLSFENAVYGPFTSLDKAHLWVRTHPDCEGSVVAGRILIKPYKVIRVPRAMQQ